MGRPLLLTGPPAAGKSTIGRRLAEGCELGAFIDVDDVRQLVVGGHVAPWQGVEGTRQQRLGVVNACSLGAGFIDNGIEVVLADVLTDATAALYRELLPDVVIVQLVVAFAEARCRFEQRPVYLTSAEFRMLYEQDAGFTGADHRLDVTRLPVAEAVSQIRGDRFGLHFDG